MEKSMNTRPNITEEFRVTYSSVPSEARYLPPYDNISQVQTDYFEEEEDAWAFALKKAREGLFDVKVCAEVSEDGIIIDFQSLGCPYLEQNIDEALNELVWHREQVEMNLSEPEYLQKWRYDELRESLEKLNGEIEKIVGSDDAEEA